MIVFKKTKGKNIAIFPAILHVAAFLRNYVFYYFALPYYKLIIVHFVVDLKDELLCKKVLDEKALNQVREAIEDLYYFEFVVGQSQASSSSVIQG